MVSHCQTYYMHESVFDYDFLFIWQHWKIDKIHKDFELYQVCMHYFLCQNVWILALYILLTKWINMSCSKGTVKCLSGSISIFWEFTQEKSTKFVKIFELHQIFIYTFLCQNVLILTNCVLPIHTKITLITFNTFQLYQ